ncbi:protein At-4/1 [Pyrus ussuriensis x Pyrus communis]|uniref:Protein At-4/1 n=1 Tax=Pyrus ussuriensis x Pyrus communis TaxID=2448454 RepID=A0A5N5HEB9_9ROSA|nr:protein At-4/1 [Pyrus ussuriensis x Pyrus communis]
MAATSDEEMDSLLSTLDQIYQDFKTGAAEIESSKSVCNAEAKKREALEFTCNNLRQENERLSRLYTESFSSVADQLERCTRSQSLKEEVKKMRDEWMNKEEEHRKAMELVKQDYAAKLDDLEAQIRGFMLEKAKNEATINHLQRDLAAHKSHMHVLASRLDHLQLDVESKYILEIQDLKDCLAIEQEEKNELNKEVQDLEKELLVSRSKLVEQKQDSNSTWQVETLKTKIMKLRKENEILKRKILHSDKG